MCRVIAVANQKGGVGKTTTCVNLGIGLARAGKKVLLVEADAQGSMAVSLGIAVYQLKNIPENRKIRFRPYSALHEKGIRIQYKDYEQVYLARMHPEDGLEQIRRRFNEKLPRTFHGHSISVSDVLVLNKGGVVTSYYVEKDGFTVIAGFIRISSSGTLVSLDTTGFHIEGKEGKWLAFDSIMIEGRQFFLMEHETYGKEVAWVVLDEKGKLIVDNVYQGFNQTVLRQIEDYLNLPQLTAEPQDQEIPDGNIQMQSGNTMDKPSLENWQKYMENGEYLRSSELDEEQNYNMIDGRRNNMPPKARMAGRPSWQSCAVNRQGLQSGAENPHSRWQWQRIWSAGGSKKGRSVWQMLSDASSFVCLEQSGVSLYNKTITGRA